MKKSRRRNGDELRPEYDFANMPGGVRGKYARRYKQGTNLALLERDVAKAFPNDEAVNETLRAVMNAASRLSQRPSQSRNKRPSAGR
jgi:hypothetical protein